MWQRWSNQTAAGCGSGLNLRLWPQQGLWAGQNNHAAWNQYLWSAALSRSLVSAPYKTLGLLLAALLLRAPVALVEMILKLCFSGNWLFFFCYIRHLELNHARLGFKREQQIIWISNLNLMCCGLQKKKLKVWIWPLLTGFEKKSWSCLSKCI